MMGLLHAEITGQTLDFIDFINLTFVNKIEKIRVQTKGRKGCIIVSRVCRF